MLDTIPIEQLIQICGHLRDEHRPSLQTFSLVNSAVRYITIPILFGTVKILLSTRDELERRLTSMPDAARLHIRHLIVEGVFKQSADKKSYAELKSDIYNKHASCETDSFFDEIEFIHRNERYLWSYYELDLVSWNSLVTLVNKLSNLREFTFSSFHHFPEVLLTALNKKTPPCNLHLPFFRISGLYGWDAPKLNKCEDLIVRSSMLRSIGAKWESCADYPDYHYEAVLDMAKHLRNIQTVRLFDEITAASLGTARPRPPWRGLYASNGLIEGESHASSLISLKLAGASPLDCWLDSMNLSRLTTLHLSDISTLEMQRLRGLDNLRCLTIRAHNPVFDAPHAIFYDAFSDCLMQLHPLQSLKLTGSISDKIYEAVLARHGSSLRQLHLMDEAVLDEPAFDILFHPFDARRIQQLAASCPDLQELTINVPRSRGDANEVAIYNALGSITKLSRLFLVLDCSQPFLGNVQIDDDVPDHKVELWLPKEDHFEDIDMKVIKWSQLYDGLRIGYIRDTYFNSALDESLARTIFNRISVAKSRGAVLLESIKVTTENSFRFNESQRGSVLDEWTGIAMIMHRDWHVYRDVRHDKHDEIHVERLNVNTDDLDGLVSSLGWRNADASPREVFQSLWPGTVEQQVWTSGTERLGPWVHNWHSFPLAD